MDELLSLLPSSAVLTILIAAGTLWIILQLTKEDASYPPRVKRILLSMAWPVFAICTIILLGLLFLALLPVLQQYSIVIPRVDIDPSIFALSLLLGVFWIIFYFIFTFVIRKFERFLPRPESERKMLAAVEKVEETLGLATHAVETSIETLEKSNKQVDEVLEMNNQVLDMNKAIAEEVIKMKKQRKSK